MPWTVCLAAVDMHVWDGLLQVLALLAIALLCGGVAERLRQSAIVGYLVAGTIVGPSVLGWVSDREGMLGIAELGVALLLFVIGLEFSPRQLMALGRVPMIAGPLQVVLTLLAGALIGKSFGLAGQESIVVGSMVALSSTASVLRLLYDRAEIDSPHGRTTLGVLLIQDFAVIPLMLIVSALARGGTALSFVGQLAISLLAAIVLIGGFYLLFTFIVPRLLQLPTWRRNRDLPVLLAVVLALGASWTAHRLNLSPALGAFVAGVLLAISPFATQIRADVQPLTTVLVTLFFASVGMLADLRWVIDNAALLAVVVTIIVLGKALIVGLLVWLMGQPLRLGVAAACCLAQVGEFSFVLATIAHGDRPQGPLLSDTAFRTLVTATIMTLVLTPYLVAAAPVLGAACQRFLPRRSADTRRRRHEPADEQAAATAAESRAGRQGGVLIIGFGPAGQRVAEELMARQSFGASGRPIMVVDLNPENLRIASRYGLTAQLGDATQSEILEHAGVLKCDAVVIAVPTTSIVRQLIHLVRHLAPGVPIFARCRYHIHHWLLSGAGADVVIDEENQVGHRLAQALIRAPQDETD
jgi:CPA2 family monovalent cation:H+ antiporter-2